MLQIERVKLELDEEESLLGRKAAAILRLPQEELRELRVLRKAVDAREGIRFVYTLRAVLRDEKRALRRHNKQVTPVREEPYRLPAPVEPPDLPPVVVGAGPGGLFCALALARCGVPPILLERGRDVEHRQADVERFWETGALDLQSNVQFGEGGAGAFSDGKLNTGTRDMRHRFILETLVSHGAPESILTDAKPHVGTDYLHRVLASLRRELEELGCDIRFGHRLAGAEREGDRLSALQVLGPEGPYRLPARQAVLALGNSARDTFAMVRELGLELEVKPFSVGVRIEHLQKEIDRGLYGEWAGHPLLPKGEYQLSHRNQEGQAVYTFCMCPGGYVVNASSEEGRLAVNGMSYHDRAGENGNSALIVSVTPKDYGSDHPLAGVMFQRRLEEAAWRAGSGAVPVQLYKDFKKNYALVVLSRTFQRIPNVYTHRHL